MSQARPAMVLKCPVCGARFRGREVCSRCGTDLAPLMRLAGRAWVLRQRCRQALRAGDPIAAIHAAVLASHLQRSRPE